MIYCWISHDIWWPSKWWPDAGRGPPSVSGFPWRLSPHRRCSLARARALVWVRLESLGGIELVEIYTLKEVNHGQMSRNSLLDKSCMYVYINIYIYIYIHIYIYTYMYTYPDTPCLQYLLTLKCTLEKPTFECRLEERTLGLSESIGRVYRKPPVHRKGLWELSSPAACLLQSAPDAACKCKAYTTQYLWYCS